MASFFAKSVTTLVDGPLGNQVTEGLADALRKVVSVAKIKPNDSDLRDAVARITACATQVDTALALVPVAAIEQQEERPDNSAFFGM